jgi:hypothetical protein
VVEMSWLAFAVVHEAELEFCLVKAMFSLVSLSAPLLQAAGFLALEAEVLRAAGEFVAVVWLHWVVVSMVWSLI